MFSKCGLCTSSITSTWKLVRNTHSWAPPENHHIRNSGGEPSSLYFNKLSGCFPGGGGAGGQMLGELSSVFASNLANTGLLREL